VSQQLHTMPGRVIVVTFAPAALLAAFEREVQLGLPAYGDPDRKLYAAIGFGRGSWARVWLDPRVVLRYAQLIARGRRPQPPRQDPLQLGGDIVVDAGLRLTWRYAGKGPDDRPSVSQLRRALQDASGSGAPISEYPGAS
jgi:hypothetical protein